MHFTISRLQKKENHIPYKRRPLYLLAQSARPSAFMVKNAYKKNGFGLGPDLTTIGSLNSNILLKIEFKKIIVFKYL
jgi:hypothetical protein